MSSVSPKKITFQLHPALAVHYQSPHGVNPAKSTSVALAYRTLLIVNRAYRLLMRGNGLFVSRRSIIDKCGFLRIFNL